MASKLAAELETRDDAKDEWREVDDREEALELEEEEDSEAELETRDDAKDEWREVEDEEEEFKLGEEDNNELDSTQDAKTIKAMVVIRKLVFMP